MNSNHSTKPTSISRNIHIMSNQENKPLASPFQQIPLSDDDELSPEFKEMRKHYRKYVVCCGVTTAVTLILVVVLIVLSFTVFHIKEPVINMRSVTFLGLDKINTTTGPTPGTSLTVMADLSVKNNNMASYRFRNASSTVFYDQVVIGEAILPPGFARARRTIDLNVTYNVMLDKVMALPRIGDDLRAGKMAVTTFTSIKGRVKILNIIKKNVMVRLYCTMTVNITTRAIDNQVCKKKISM